MDKKLYIQIMSEVFDGLQEYHPILRDSRFRDHIANTIWRGGVQDTGDTQKDYERLRDRVEGFLSVFLRGPKDWFPGIPPEE